MSGWRCSAAAVWLARSGGTLRRAWVSAGSARWWPALGRARGPVLLAGGTADPYWDGRIARSVTPDVVEISGADHSMLVPGRLSASAAVLGQVLTAVEDFLDHSEWP
jgi:hypothetical protein